MSDCGHTPKYPDLHSVPTLQECMSHCQIVEDEPSVQRQRALTSEDGETTRLDQGYWSGLNDTQKAAVVAHERAHPCIGMQVNCEGCADMVGGYFMRAWGYSPAVVRASFGTLRVQRKPEHGNIADNAYKGARFAERGLAERGLLGATMASTSAKLAQERALLPTTQLVIKTTSTTPNTLTGTPTFTTTQPAPTSGTSTGFLTTPTGVSETTSTPSTSTAPTAAQVSGAPLKATPATPLAPSTTVAQGSSPGAPATATDAAIVAGVDAGVAGDVVSAVLGEDARAHTGKVLIAAGVAAIVAVVLVVVVRRRST